MAIALDFDGPIHSYERGWHDGSIYGSPVPGAFDAIRRLMAVDAVFIHTTRQPAPVARWLTSRGGFDTLVDTGEHGAFWNQRGVLLVTSRKYAAHAYVDDRAVPFTGDWDQALQAVAALSPAVRTQLGCA